METPIDDLENTDIISKPRNYAGFWLRFLAFVIDSIILSIASSFINSPILKLMGVYMVETVDAQRQEEAQRMLEQNLNMMEYVQYMMGITAQQLILVVLVGVIINWLYYALMESSPKKATLGKMAFGLQVTDLEGDQISFGRATVRNFAKYLSGFIFFIGYIMAGLTEKKQALHDIIAGCLVYQKSNS